MHNPKFEINKSTDGKYYFHFRDSNGKIIYVSETYETNQGARVGIDAAKRGTSNAPIVDNTKK
jgi:uncharacterized protein YegP (UPF0339 family)